MKFPFSKIYKQNKILQAVYNSRSISFYITMWSGFLHIFMSLLIIIVLSHPCIVDFSLAKNYTFFFVIAIFALNCCMKAETVNIEKLPNEKSFVDCIRTKL